jgi:RNA recognition motif-containing protein
MKYKITIPNDNQISNLSAQISQRRAKYSQKNVLQALAPKVTKKQKKQANQKGENNSISDISQKVSTITVELSNLSRNATENDVKVLLKKYGKIKQVVMKHTGGLFIGKVLVTFTNRESGERIIRELNGIIADGMTLRVREIQNTISIAGLSLQNNGQLKIVRQETTRGLYSDSL